MTDDYDDDLRLRMAEQAVATLATGNLALDAALQEYLAAAGHRRTGDEEGARRRALRGYALCSWADELSERAEQLGRLVAGDPQPPFLAA